MLPRFAPTPTSSSRGNTFIMMILAKMRKHIVVGVVVVAIFTIITLIYLRPSSIFTDRQKENNQQVQVSMVPEENPHKKSSIAPLGTVSPTNLREMLYPGKPAFSKYSKKSELYDLVIITDMDKKSKDDSKTWKSLLKRGVLIRDPRTGKYSVEWGSEIILHSRFNEAGRGMELSELVHWNGGLYTFDDRTGIVYEITGEKVIPKFILMDGDGNVAKGLKIEWATVKDGLLVVGSTGKEWSTPQGEYVNSNPQYIKIIDSQGRIKHVSWTPVYESLRKATGTEFPGYLLHEAVRWNPSLRRWFFLPRRESQERYDEVEDESRGSNLVLSMNEYFGDLKTQRIGTLNPTHGFSSFQFLPWRPNELVALKSEEFGDNIGTYITVMNLDGEILMEEEFVGAYKFEGLEIV